MKKRKVTSITIFLCLGILIIVGFVGYDNTLSISRYKIKTKKIKNDIKIVQISDFHNDLYGENQKELIEKIDIEKPDLIFITGDIMYETQTIDNTNLLLKNIKKIAPIYYVTGNHEYSDEKLDVLFKLLKKYNIKSLFDDSVIIKVNNEKVRISGLDDSEGYRYWDRETTSKERLANLKSDNQRLHLLLSHRPELADEYAKNNFDVVFTGHAHGGQIRVPGILKGVIAPNQGLLPKYTRGTYKLNDKTTMVVSAGLIRNQVPRIFNKPDLVVTTIVSEK